MDVAQSTLGVVRYHVDVLVVLSTGIKQARTNCLVVYTFWHTPSPSRTKLLSIPVDRVPLHIMQSVCCPWGLTFFLKRVSLLHRIGIMAPAVVFISCFN